MPDLFIDKNVSPMLIGHEVEPYDDEESIFELKLDGIRCIAYIDTTSVILRNKRNKDVTSLYPELQCLKHNVKKSCILDGELIVLKNGKPDFFSIQKRSLMTDSFKIKLMARTHLVQFVVFDILYFDGKDVTHLPLLKRKAVLSKNVMEKDGLSISRFIEKQGIDFFNLAKANALEGIVGKKKNSFYVLGKRTKDWKKIKVMMDEDLIICGYKENEEGEVKDLVLGYYDRKQNLKCRGSISLGISKEDKAIIKDFAKHHRVSSPWFNEFKDIIWLELELVGIAHYMQKTETGHMRQAVFYGIRDDKEARDCIGI